MAFRYSPLSSRACNNQPLKLASLAQRRGKASGERAPPLARLAATAANPAIRTGVVRNAPVIGAELISAFMDQADRNVAVLFGDGAAVRRWQFEGPEIFQRAGRGGAKTR